MDEELDIKLPDDIDFGTEEEILKEKYEMELAHVNNLMEGIKKFNALPKEEQNEEHNIDNIRSLREIVENIINDYKNKDNITFHDLKELKTYLEEKLEVESPSNGTSSEPSDATSDAPSDATPSDPSSSDKKDKIKELRAKKKELADKAKSIKDQISEKENRFKELKNKKDLTQEELEEMQKLVLEISSLKLEYNKLVKEISDLQSEITALYNYKTVEGKMTKGEKTTSKTKTPEKDKEAKAKSPDSKAKKADKDVTPKDEEASSPAKSSIVTPVITAPIVGSASAPVPASAPMPTTSKPEMPKENISEYNNKFINDKIKALEAEGKVRGASGHSFNYIKPILDENGKIIDCEFLTDSLNDTRYGLYKFANNPLRAFKAALNKKIASIEKMQLFTPDEKVDLKKYKKELIADFETHLKNNNADYCVEKMMAICTATTHDEVMKVLKDKEYPLDNYNVSVAKTKTSTSLLRHSEKELNKRIVFSVNKEKTISDLHPSRDAASGTFRIKRSERRENRRRILRRRTKKHDKTDIDR